MQTNEGCDKAVPKEKDLTGRRFGSLVVLRKAATPYISPSGKKTIRWVCKCEACGREVTMLRNTLIYATSCGCKRSESAKKKERNQKVCVVCGNKFDSPPSERKKTCSPECSSVLRAKIQTGTKHAWSDEAKRRYSQNTAHIQQAKEQVVEATKKAASLPEGQRGAQNRECKVWILKDPFGNIHRAVGLRPWARSNYELFEPASTDIEATTNRIASGLYAVAATLCYNSPSRQNNPTSTYKGWTVVSVRDKNANEQLQAMIEHENIKIKGGTQK